MRREDCHPPETTEFLLAALEQAFDAVIITDDENNIIRFNAAAERMWGLGRQDVLGRDVRVLVPINMRARHDEAIAANRATGINRNGGRSVEVSIVRADGSQVWGALSLSRVEIDGRTSYMAFVRDVTAEVRSREKLAIMSLVADRTNRAVLVTDSKRRIIYINDAFTDMFGYALSEVKGRKPSRLLAGEYTDRKALARLQRLIGTADNAEQELLAYDRNGNEVWISATITVIRNPTGELTHVIGLLTDITATKQLQSLQHLILAALADEMPIREVLDLLCRRVEIIAPDVISSVLHIDSAGLIHPLGGPSLPEHYSRSLDGVAIGPEVGSCGSAAFYGEPVLVTDIATDRRWLPYNAAPLAAGLRACWSTPIKAKDGRVIGTFAFYFRECREPSRWHKRIVDACIHLGALAIEREESRAQIARLAYHDMLTGLPNRAQLRDLIEQTIEECRADQKVALLFLDLDHFKDVNDSFGHAVGDELLIGVTQRLRTQIRPGDILSRLGGDEFVIVLPNCDTETASTLASRITQALSAPMRLGSKLVPISASMGISIYPDNARDIDDLMKQADAAMYKAKQAGRSTHRFFSADMNRLAEQRLAHSSALRGAIARSELKLHYQPQIRTADGAIYGVEALARWRDPVLGEVSPARFIPLAEECGLIEQIGVWSMREACSQMAAWRQAGIGVPCVSVNLSPINFQNADLAATVASLIGEYGLPPEALTLEVTEGVVMSEHSTAIQTMNEIRKLGVGLSLDDFGTGYSSLSRLAHLPIRELKIDRSFMRDIEDDACALAVATTVIRVGQTLHMKVVAEGVETQGQRELLTELGCDVVQGFLHAPALAPAEFERWLVEYGATHAAAMLRGVGQASLNAPLRTTATMRSRKLQR